MNLRGFYAKSHLVLAQILRREVLEPGFGLFLRVPVFRGDGLGLIEDGLGGADVLALPASLQFGGWLGLIIVGALAWLLYRTGRRRTA